MLRRSFLAALPVVGALLARWRRSPAPQWDGGPQNVGLIRTDSALQFIAERRALLRSRPGALLLALALLPSGLAQAQDRPYTTLAFRLNVNGVGVGNAEYPRMSNQWSAPEVGPRGALIQTSGSSTTVEAVTAGTAPFLNVAVGDAIYTSAGIRSVTAKASNDSITVHTAITLTNSTFGYRRATIAAGTGWWRADQFPEHTVYIEGVTVGGDVTCFVECRSGAPEAGPVQVYPGSTTTCALATSGNDVAVYIPEPHAFCRVGIYNTNFNNTHAINVFVQGGN